MTLVFIWLALAAIIGVAASNHRNRDGFAWFALAVIVSPLIAGLLLLALKPLPPGERRGVADIFSPPRKLAPNEQRVNRLRGLAFVIVAIVAAAIYTAHQQPDGSTSPTQSTEQR